MRRLLSPIFTALFAFSTVFAPAVVAAPAASAVDGSWCATISSYANYTAKLAAGTVVSSGKVRNHSQVCWHNNAGGAAWDSFPNPTATNISQSGGYRALIGTGTHPLTVFNFPNTDTAYVDWKVGGNVGALTCRSKMVHEHYTYPNTSGTIFWTPHLTNASGIDGYAQCVLNPLTITSS